MQSVIINYCVLSEQILKYIYDFKWIDICTDLRFYNDGIPPSIKSTMTSDRQQWHTVCQYSVQRFLKIYRCLIFIPLLTCSEVAVFYSRNGYYYFLIFFFSYNKK